MASFVGQYAQKVATGIRRSAARDPAVVLGVEIDVGLDDGPQPEMVLGVLNVSDAGGGGVVASGLPSCGEELNRVDAVAGGGGYRAVLAETENQPTARLARPGAEGARGNGVDFLSGQPGGKLLMDLEADGTLRPAHALGARELWLIRRGAVGACRPRHSHRDKHARNRHEPARSESRKGASEPRTLRVARPHHGTCPTFDIAGNVSFREVCSGMGASSIGRRALVTTANIVKPPWKERELKSIHDPPWKGPYGERPAIAEAFAYI